MPQHFTRNTVWAMAWCAKCKKQTPHQGGEVKLGSCLDCIERLKRESEARKNQQAEEVEQRELF